MSSCKNESSSNAFCQQRKAAFYREGIACVFALPLCFVWMLGILKHEFEGCLGKRESVAGHHMDWGDILM